MCVTPQEEAYSSDAQRTQEAKESGREGSIDIPRHARELAMRRAVAETSKRLDDREDVGSEGSGFEGEDQLADEDRIPPLSQQLVAASQLFNITFYYSIIIPTIREYCITLNAGECARSQSPSRTNTRTQMLTNPSHWLCSAHHCFVVRASVWVARNAGHGFAGLVVGFAPLSAALVTPLYRIMLRTSFAGTRACDCVRSVDRSID